MGPIDQHIREQLRDCYDEREAAAISRIVCCEVLGQSMVDYCVGKDMQLSAIQKEKLATVIARLRANEPIQYIQQLAWFQGRRFFVSPAVLIPRQETGELVEHVLRRVPADASVLDVGTGSGCIAVTLAKELERGQVSAWDVSAAALEVARLNAREHDVDVRFQQVDVLTLDADDLPCAIYDAIVSNPPYVTRKEARQMEPHVLEHEPHLALFVDDADPLLFYRTIGQLGLRLLKSGGWLCYEINRAYGPQVVSLLQNLGYAEAEVLTDISHNDRFVFARR